MRLRLHRHRDPEWRVVGIWAYATCHRCDAVRIWLYATNLMGPCAPGWSHLLVDLHGRHLVDSGWVRGNNGLRKPTHEQDHPIKPVPFSQSEAHRQYLERGGWHG